MTTRGAEALETLTRGARRAGRQLWLASLGAAGVVADAAPQLAGRCRRMVDRLVEKGQPLAERGRERRRDRGRRWAARLDELGDHAGRTVQGAATLARETAEYESRRLLERLDLATAEDLALLAARLEALDRKLDDYGRRLAATAATARPTGPAAPDGS